MDFPITLDKDLSVPLWKQLYYGLRDQIVSGNLLREHALPPTRQLSHLLDVSRDTVLRCYEELERHGYIRSATGAGTFVCFEPSSPEMSVLADPRSPQGRSHRPLSQYAVRLMLAGATDISGENFTAAPADLLPLSQWRWIMMRLNSQTGTEAASRTETNGYAVLRQAIAAYVRRTKGIECRAEQVVTFSDSNNLLDLVARMLIDPGDTVLVENPGSNSARAILLAHGARLHPIPVDQDGLITDELDRLSHHCKFIYVTPFHHDPTGFVMSLERRRKLLAWAKRNGVLIIEDAFDSDYRYGSQPLPALMRLDETGLVIHLYSFWKVLFPITGMGCLLVPPDLVNLLDKAKALYKDHIPVDQQYAMADFLNEGYLERHIRKTWTIYMKRRQALIYSLAQNFRSSVTYFKESAGSNLLVRFNIEASEEEILQQAGKAGLPMESTQSFYIDNFVRREFVIPFSSLPEDRVDNLVKNFASRLQSKLCNQATQQPLCVEIQPT